MKKSKTILFSVLVAFMIIIGATNVSAATDYTIKKGDNLWNISKLFYGEGIFYKDIFEANKQIIKNPNLIIPGQTITLPEVSIKEDENYLIYDSLPSDYAYNSIILGQNYIINTHEDTENYYITALPDILDIDEFGRIHTKAFGYMYMWFIDEKNHTWIDGHSIFVGDEDASFGWVGNELTLVGLEDTSNIIGAKSSDKKIATAEVVDGKLQMSCIGQGRCDIELTYKNNRKETYRVNIYEDITEQYVEMVEEYLNQ